MKRLLCLACFLLPLACSDDEQRAPASPAAGSSGRAGSDASAGLAGSSPSGPGGSGGAGATGGLAGAGPGGSAGISGDSGQSGSSGASGQSGSSGTSGQSGSSGASGQSGSSGASGQPGTPCDGALADGLAVASVDLYRYPPYAIDGCALLYLAPVAGGNELRRRDLTSGQEEVLADASESPARPTLAGTVAAWEATDQGHPAVRVRVNGVTMTIQGDFAQASEPRASADAVVFTAWKTLDPKANTDVLLYHVDTKTLTPIAATPGQQRFPEISATHVAFSDFSEDPDGVLDEDNQDLADIALYNRATGALEPRLLPGKQAFPLLGSPGSVVFLSWPSEHPEPKFTAFEIQASALTAGAQPRLLGAVTQSHPVIARPSSQGGVVTWVTYNNGNSALFRASLDEGATPQPVTIPPDVDLFAPVLHGDAILLASRPTAQPDALPHLLLLP